MLAPVSLALPCLVALAAGLASPADDGARLSCGYSELVLERLPAPGATDVPSNARLWLNIPAFNYPPEELDSLALVGPEGPVELVRSVVDTRWIFTEPEDKPIIDLWVYTPVEPLVPGLHEVVVAGNSDWSFTVGGPPDEVPPPVPVVDSISYTTNPDEGSAHLHLKGSHDIVILEQEDRASLEPSTLSGQAVEVFTGDVVLFGHDLCLNNWGMKPGWHTRVRLSAFDVAGNHSGFGEWIDIDIPERHGCSVAPVRAPAWFLLALALLGRRRRR